MKLDCNTPAGRLAIAQQREVLHAACRYFNATLGMTDDTCAAPVDAVLMKGGVISAVVEVKCRVLTVAQLEHYGSLLITATKLDELREAARLLCADGYVLAYLTLDSVVAYWHVCDDLGVACFPWATEVTRTQATVNGGEAHRNNAFLPFTLARFFPITHEHRAA